MSSTTILKMNWLAEQLTNLSEYSVMAQSRTNYTEYITLNKSHGVMGSTSNVLLKVKSFCNFVLLLQNHITELKVAL